MEVAVLVSRADQIGFQAPMRGRKWICRGIILAILPRRGKITRINVNP